MEAPGGQIHVEALVAEIVPLPLVAFCIHYFSLEDYLSALEIIQGKLT